MSSYAPFDITQAVDQEDIQRYSSMLTNQAHTHVDTVRPLLSNELMEGGLRYAASKGKHEAFPAMGAV